MTTANRLGPIYDGTRNSGWPHLSDIYIGFVKANDDGQRMGRLSVWIPEIGGEPDDESSWIICSYASPFAGASDITQIAGYTTNNQIAQQSYGLWAVPPDLNNEVAVFFANGDIARAYWFACTYQQSMNHMVPGIAVNITTEPEPPQHVSPVIEYNKSDTSINPDSPRRPPFEPLTNGLKVEGLTSDNERGSASTSAQREAPSQVYGMLSPRGNTLHIDDNTANEFIRLRTRSGAQVLLHETTGYVYINSKNGNSWIEISDAGIDCYTSNSISMRGQADVNIRADRDILLDAGANIRMNAVNDITMTAGGNIQQQATGKINQNASGNIELTSSANILNIASNNFQVTTKENDVILSSGHDIHMNAANDWMSNAGHDIQTNAGNNWVLSMGQDGTILLGRDMSIQAEKQISLQSNELSVKTEKQISLQSGDDMNVKSGRVLYLTSKKDTHQRAVDGDQIRDGLAILDQTGASKPAPDAPGPDGGPPQKAQDPFAPVTLSPPVHMPALVLGDARQKVVNSDPPYWQGNAAQVTTIVRRMPTHEPWHDHPNSDVPPPPTECIEINAEGTFGAGSSSNLDAPTTYTTGSGDTVTLPGQKIDAGCSTGVGGTKPIATEVYNAIMNACTKTGADPATMLAFADMESSFQPGIGAKTSSATGLYQFTQTTWHAMVTKYGAQYNVGYGQINDATGNALMGGQFMNDNVAILKRNGVSNPTPGQIYIMHFMGSGGGPKLIKAAQSTPDAPASLMFPAAAGANSTIFRDKTTSQVVASLSAKADAKAKAYAGQYGLPAPCDRSGAGSNAVKPLDPPATAAAEMTAPQPINIATQPSGSVPTGDGRPPPPTVTPPTVASGGTGQVCQAGTDPVPSGTNGFVGPTSQSASLLNAAGVTNTSQWRKGSTDITTWVKGQPIAIFNDDGTYSGNHSAIFLGVVKPGSQDYNGVSGILVYDQSPGQEAKQRIIPFDVANPNNATLYAAVNKPGGGDGTAMEPDFAPNAQGADRIRQACIKEYPTHTGDCSGFVKAVAHDLGITDLNGMDANAIVKHIKSSWTVISGGAAAAAAAAGGQLVVAGLEGPNQTSPAHHGHVVVVVAGPVANGAPTGYWGSLGYIPGAYKSISASWTRQDFAKLIYASKSA